MTNSFKTFIQEKYWANLDGLRAIAILMVIFHHIPPIQISWLQTLQHNGRYGVALFFVISGFLISSLLIREKTATQTINLYHFYMRRALRLYPLYYLMLGFECVLVFGLGQYSPDNQLLFKDKLLSYIFYFSNLLSTATIGPFFYAWSLAVEEQFYLVYAAVAKVFRLRVILLGAISLILLKLAYHLLPLPHFPGDGIERLVFSYQEPIIIGVILGILSHHSATFNRITSLINKKTLVYIIVILLIILLTLFNMKDKTSLITLCFYLLSGLLVWYLSIKKPLLLIGKGLLPYIGRISYGIYLFHMLVINILKRIPVINAHPLLLFCISLIGTVCIASISYSIFERPILNFKKRFSYQ